MKKILVLITVLALSLIFVACGEQPTELDMLKASLVRADRELMVGTCEEYRVELVSFDEKGEESVKDEGEKGARTIILKVMPREIKNTGVEYKVVLKNKDGTKHRDIKVTKDVLGMTFSSNISSDILDFNVVSVDIIRDNDSKNIVMKNILDGAKLDAEAALRVGYTELKDSMTDYFEDGKYVGKSVVKLIHNNRVEDSPYYFYVSFLKDDDEFVSCLIDPATGEIVNKKIK